ncbi:MAG: class I SAM-dependent methyltransferase [Myxococcota bacterium]
MDPELSALLRDDVELHRVDEGLWTAFGAGGRAERYDDIAARYDRVIGSRFYQRIAWGNDPANDVRFAEEAVASADGALLDVGCGSLLFTAEAHARSRRPSLLVDLSLGMLRRGADRLRALGGGMPEHLALVQADALDLPVRPGTVDTVLCPGIVHLFDDPAGLVRSLASALAPGGRLFLSGLVTDRSFGRRYLRLLARSGEVKCELSGEALASRVEQATGLPVALEVFGNMAYLRAGPAPAATAGAPAPDRDGANAAMVEHWNDRAGPSWVAGQPALDAHLEPLGRRGLAVAAARPGERVLDVGCGCGASALELARAVGPRGRVLGVDLSVPMLARARERAEEAGLDALAFENADAQVHPFDGGFDLVFSRFGVMFFSDFAAAFANLRRALVPGGRLVFLCWRELERNPWMQVPLQAVAEEIPVAPPAPPGEPGPYGLADAALLEQVLASAGFADPKLASIDLLLPVRGGANVAESADFYARQTAVGAAVQAADPERRLAAHAALRRAFESYEVDGRVLLGASAWCVTARNPG